MDINEIQGYITLRAEATMREITDVANIAKKDQNNIPFPRKQS